MARGSISPYVTKEGITRWRVRVTMIDPATGKRHQPQRTYDTERLAEKGLAAWLVEIDRGEAVASSAMTVAEMVAAWLEVSRHAVEPSTYERYEAICRKELVPLLGTVRLQALTPERVEHAYISLLGHYARSTVRTTHTVFRLACEWAVDRRMLPRNPAQKATRVLRKQRAEQDSDGGAGKVYTRTEAVRILAALEGVRHGPVYALLLGLGLRRGEALGLRWQDLDLPPAHQPRAAGRLRVAQANADRPAAPGYAITRPKSPSARRSLVLPAPLCRLLQGQRERVMVVRGEAGDTWQEHDLVFPAADGTPASPDSLYYPWTRLCQELGVPRRTLHQLRHTFATLSLLNGVPITVVARHLGHSSPAITLKTYAHVIKEAEEASADKLTALFWPAAETPRDAPIEGQNRAS